MNLETGCRRIDDTGARSESLNPNQLGYPLSCRHSFLFFYSGGRKCINDTQERTQGPVVVCSASETFPEGDCFCSNDHEFQQ